MAVCLQTPNDSLVLTRKLSEQKEGDCSSGQHGSSEMKYLDRLTEELAGSVLAVI